MNWDAVGALAELIGATAVVASLVYVAFQIQHNTRSVRAAATKDAASTIRGWFDAVTADPELSRIFSSGVEGMEELSLDDRARFAFLAFNLLKAAEDVHYQAVHGLLDADLWKGWDHMFNQYFTAPGMQQYWKIRRPAFSDRFCLYVDSLGENPDAVRVASLGAALES